MLLSDGHDAEAWSGHTGGAQVAWIEGVRPTASARAHGATLNYVLLVGGLDLRSPSTSPSVESTNY